MELLGYSISLVVKYVAYTAWCYTGLRLLAASHARPWKAAFALGAARLALGIALGLFIFFAALTRNNATRNAPLTYLSIYVPVRIVEWSIFHVLIGGFAGIRSAGWVLGGVVVSCLADIPIGIMEGGVVPVGRPFC